MSLGRALCVPNSNLFRGHLVPIVPNRIDDQFHRIHQILPEFQSNAVASLPLPRDSAGFSASLCVRFVLFAASLAASLAFLAAFASRRLPNPRSQASPRSQPGGFHVSTFLRVGLFASRVGIASLLGNASFHRRAFRPDAPQRSETPPQVASPFPLFHRASSFISKALGLCFDAETQFLASGVSISSSIAASISQLHLALLQCVSRDLSFFPLFMKRVMQSSIAVFSHCVAGLDLQADSLLESLFAFLIAAYDIFESKIRDDFDCLVANSKRWSVCISSSIIVSRSGTGRRSIWVRNPRGFVRFWGEIRVVETEEMKGRCGGERVHDHV